MSQTESKLGTCDTRFTVGHTTSVTSNDSTVIASCSCGWIIQFAPNSQRSWDMGEDAVRDHMRTHKSPAPSETERSPTLDTLLRQHHLSFRCSRATYEWYMGRKVEPDATGSIMTRFNLAYSFGKGEQVEFTFDDTLAFKQWVPVKKNDDTCKHSLCGCSNQPDKRGRYHCEFCCADLDEKAFNAADQEEIALLRNNSTPQPAGEGTLPPSWEEIDRRQTKPLVPGLTQGQSNWWHRLQGELHEACVYENPHSVLSILNLLSESKSELREARASLARLREKIRRFLVADDADTDDKEITHALRELREEAMKS